VAASADVCRGLSSTASSGSAAAGVPSEAHMTGTSRGSLAGELASADDSTINVGAEGLSALIISAGEPSSDYIVRGWTKHRMR
jgi:hypothetical protein